MNISNWIVMVEDDPDMHYLYRRVFAGLGMEDRLMLFDNALDALSFLNSNYHNTSIIFSDVNMPMVDGIELRKRINASQPSKQVHVPFVFLSTSAGESDLQKTAHLNVQGFFEKGETLKDIQSTIKFAIEAWDSLPTHQQAVN